VVAFDHGRSPTPLRIALTGWRRRPKRRQGIRRSVAELVVAALAAEHPRRPHQIARTWSLLQTQIALQAQPRRSSRRPMRLENEVPEVHLVIFSGAGRKMIVRRSCAATAYGRRGSRPQTACRWPYGGLTGSQCMAGRSIVVDFGPSLPEARSSTILRAPWRRCRRSSNGSFGPYTQKLDMMIPSRRQSVSIAFSHLGGTFFINFHSQRRFGVAPKARIPRIRGLRPPPSSPVRNNRAGEAGAMEIRSGICCRAGESRNHPRLRSGNSGGRAGDPESITRCELAPLCHPYGSSASDYLSRKES